MDRRIILVALFVILILLALALAGMASGAGSTSGNPRPSMSGEFAHMQLAGFTTHAAPRIHLPADGWHGVRDPNHLPEAHGASFLA